MLTRESFNAFLKTLEEPPEHTIFIFATTDAHKVPLTIISRCQRFDFRRIQLDKIKETLKMIANEEKIEIIETLWRIVYVDGKMDQYEHYLINKLQNLLRLTHEQLIAAKLKILDAEK